MGEGQAGIIQNTEGCRETVTQFRYMLLIHNTAVTTTRSGRLKSLALQE
jgi:hypothetical protein